MNESRICNDCGAPIPADAPGGHCPSCLLEAMLPGFPTRCFGEYELLQEIARGGMGVVYRARQAGLNRVVALKMILAGQLATEEEIRRFRGEAEAAARLDHPHIVPIYEIGEHEGRHFFVMKLVEGGNLAHRLLAAERGQPSDAATFGREAQKEIARLIATCARAVHFAHQHGILHRDLKPANILLDAAGEPHLTDFGLARRLDVAAGNTLSGLVLGSPAYMSPEQAVGQTRQLTTATDIYSLGAILYHFLAGRPPFHAATALATLRFVLETDPERPSTHRLGVDRDLEIICLKCLEKEPRHRYQSAESLADDLERWQRSEPIQARPATLDELALKWIHRHPQRAVGLAALILVGLLALAGVIWQWREAESARAGTLRANAELTALVNRLRFERAEDFLARGKAQSAMPLLALILEENSMSRDAAARLMSALDQRRFALPAIEMVHSNFVRFADFSPTEKLIVSASDDGTARLWREGISLNYSLRHSAAVNTARFSRDGTRVVTASEDGTACIWETRTGRRLSELIHKGDVVTAEFSPDGRMVLTASADGTAQLWDAETGHTVGLPLCHTGGVSDACFSPDGTMIVTAGIDKTARVWSAHDGTFLGLEFAHEANVKRAVFSSDSRKIATASRDGTARVWSVTTGRPITAPLVHSEKVSWVEFDPFGRRVVTASVDGMARVWDAETGRAQTPWLRHGERVRFAEFSPDGQLVVTASSDSTVRIWNATSGQQVLEPILHNGPVHLARFARNGCQLLTASEDHTARLWSLPRSYSPPYHVLFRAEEPVRQLVISPDGSRLAALIGDSAVRVWNSRSGQPLTPSLVCSNSLECMAFDENGRRLIAGGRAKWARVWDATTGQVRIPFLLHNGAIMSVSFSPDGSRILTTSDDWTARIWNAANGQSLFAPIRHGGRVAAAGFSPDGQRFATGSGDGFARIWDAATGKLLVGPLPHSPNVEAIQFSPDGAKLLTRSRDGTVRLWDARSGAAIPVSFVHHATIETATFSPKGDLLFTASRSGQSLQVWESETGRAVAQPIHLNGPGGNTRFSPDGERIVTSAGSSVQAWDARSAMPVSEAFQHPAKVNDVVFGLNGDVIYSALENGEVRVWQVPAAPVPVPPWLSHLAQVLVAARADSNGVIKPQPVRSFFALRRQMMVHNSSTNEFYARWAHDFLQRTEPVATTGASH